MRDAAMAAAAAAVATTERDRDGRDTDSGRETVFRWRERCVGPPRWLENALRDSFLDRETSELMFFVLKYFCKSLSIACYWKVILILKGIGHIFYVCLDWAIYDLGNEHFQYL